MPEEGSQESTQVFLLFGLLAIPAGFCVVVGARYRREKRAQQERAAEQARRKPVISKDDLSLEAGSSSHLGGLRRGRRKKTDTPQDAPSGLEDAEAAIAREEAEKLRQEELLRERENERPDEKVGRLEVEISKAEALDLEKKEEKEDLERRQFDIGPTQAKIDEAFRSMWAEERSRRKRSEKRHKTREQARDANVPEVRVPLALQDAQPRGRELQQHGAEHARFRGDADVVLDLPSDATVEYVAEKDTRLLVRLPQIEGKVRKPLDVMVDLPKMKELEEHAMNLKIDVPAISQEQDGMTIWPVKKPVQLLVQVPRVLRWPVDLVVPIPTTPAEIMWGPIEAVIKLDRIKDVVLKPCEVLVQLPQLHEAVNHAVELVVEVPAIEDQICFPIELKLQLPKILERDASKSFREQRARGKLVGRGATPAAPAKNNLLQVSPRKDNASPR